MKYAKTIVIMSAFAVLLIPSAAGQTAYPLKKSANSRYLVDQNDRPFLLLGDASHSLLQELPVKEVETYLKARQQEGYNGCIMHTFWPPGTTDGRTHDGIKPFDITGDVSTHNAVFFTRMADYVKRAAAKGMVVFLDPIGANTSLPVMLGASDSTKAFNYGVHLGTTFKDHPNIIWFFGDDYVTGSNAEIDKLVIRIIEGIKSADSNHKFFDANYWGSIPSTTLDSTVLAPYMTLNGAYTYNPTYDKMYHAYEHSPVVPAYQQEANYEGENNTGQDPAPNTDVLRRQEYWTMLSGGCGQMWGSAYWDFHGEWQDNLDSTGARQAAVWKNFFASIRWYDLVPDRDHTVVTAGYGTYNGSGSIRASDYLTAARIANGTLVVAYVPGIRAFTVDTGRLSGPATALWFDPANGVYTKIAGAPFANSGPRDFTPPGKNSAGENDWVLVLTAAGGTLPSPWANQSRP